MEKNRKLALFFPLAFLIWMVGFLLKLSGWVAVIVALVISGIIIYFIPKEPSELEEEEEETPAQPEQAPPATLKSRIFGAAGSLAILVIALAIIGFLAFALAGLIIPWPDEIIAFNSSDDLNKIQIVSGNWKVSDGNLEGNGQFHIVGSESWNLGIIEIVPSEKFPSESIAFVGPNYKIRNFLGLPRNNYPWYNQSGLYYRGEFFYGKSSMNGISVATEPEKKDDSPYPIQIRRMSVRKWFGSIIGIWKDSGDPEIRINGKFLIKGSRNDNYPPYEGMVSLFFEQKVNIKEVKYYCGSVTCKIRNLI